MSFRTDQPRRRRWTGTAIAVLTAAMIAAPVAAVAAEDSPVTWAVTPADENGPDGRRVVDLEVDPGESVTEHLAVRNLSEREATFTLGASDGYYTATGRFTMLPQSEESVGAGTWVAIEPSVTLAANETRVVPFTVTVPPNATPGDHAAGVAASVRSSGTDGAGAQVGVDSRVGFRLSMRVAGELAPALTVEDVQADYVPSWSLFAPGRVDVSYEVTNAGNTALEVADRTGDTPSTRGTLLPGESRRVEVDPVSAWPLGLLFLDLEVMATAPGTSLSAIPAAHDLVVWAVPWFHLLAAIGVALLLVAIFADRRRRRRRFDDLLRRAREEGRRESVMTP